MNAALAWTEDVFASIPLPALAAWGRFSYGIGFGLAIYAFGGLTLRPGGRWGFGRQRQTWDAKAFLSIPLTVLFVFVGGYLGSFKILVPGAQTLESLKDLSVFLCVVLFGYPALVAVPLAYGLSDVLIEGIPPEFLLAWLPGYFINPACFWVAHRLIGKNPDFRRVRTWGRYLIFVVFFLAVEPALWGFVCSGKFTAEISYRHITPALFFTTSLTWVVAPFAMLGALPLARRLGLFWAEVAGRVKERPPGATETTREAGKGEARPPADIEQGLPIRMFILTPFIALVLVLVGVTAYVTLQSAARDATKLATRLQEETSKNISLLLDEYSAGQPAARDSDVHGALDRQLASLPIAAHGRAFVVDRSGSTIASSVDDDPVVRGAIASLRQALGGLRNLRADVHFRFDHVTVRPLWIETWLARATAYRDRGGGHADWILVTAMPAADYLAGVRTGNIRSAMVLTLALLLSLAVADLLASMVTRQLRRISRATGALAQGDLTPRLPSSRVAELDILAHDFNDMAGQLQRSFDEQLEAELQLRRHRDHLEELVAERTAALSRSFERLRELERLRDNLVHMVVHDLRTPLNIIIGYIRMVQESQAGSLSDEAAEDLRTALQAAGALADMTNELLDVSRLEEGKMPLQRAVCDLAKMAGFVCGRLAGMDSTREIRVEAASPVPVSCDGAIVQRVLENLVGNGIKHTPSGGVLRISAAVGEGRVRVSVQDEGPGVPPAARAKIFEKFGTVEARKSGIYHSAGLGLAFCKLAVEAHGGAIGVDSLERGGSIFWFELPAD